MKTHTAILLGLFFLGITLSMVVFGQHMLRPEKALVTKATKSGRRNQC